MLDRRRLCALVSLAVVVLLPQLALSSPVSVTGGFTGFSGPVGNGGGTFFETFINGVSVCPDAGCDTGIGNLSYSFAAPLGSVEFYDTDLGFQETLNALTFTPAASQDVTLGEEFLLGTFTFTNGDWYGDSDFAFTLESVSSDPLLDGFVFADTLHLSISRGLQPTPAQNADWVWFVGAPQLGSVRAFEDFDNQPGGNTVTWELRGMISSLDVTAFANATGGGFLYPTVLPIPEPGVAVLLAAAGIALARLPRRAAPRTR